MSQSGEKTEQPTAKRLRDARRRGQVSRSQDLTSAVLFIGAMLVLWLAGDFMGGRLVDLTRDGITRAASEGGRLDEAAALQAMMRGAWMLALVLAPFFAVLVVAGALVTYLQVGPSSPSSR